MTAGRASRTLAPARPGRKSSGLGREIHELTTRRTTWLEVDEQISRINAKLRGWSNYFRIGTISKAYRSIDAHVRQRVRQWLRAKFKVKGSGKKRYPDALPLPGAGSVSSFSEPTRQLFVGERVSRLVRKLDAGKPPVQFDERGVETEHLATAPLLDSTHGSSG